MSFTANEKQMMNDIKLSTTSKSITFQFHKLYK